MKLKYLLRSLILINLLFITMANATKYNYFDKGKAHYEKMEFEKSKFLFEKDIVFNPKNENSYLYLAKIFNKKENDAEEEMNLNSVLLLNPQNDEAIYMLIILKIAQSDYSGTKDLIDQFELVCDKFCFKKKEVQSKFNKLIPNNEKNNN